MGVTAVQRVHLATLGPAALDTFGVSVSGRAPQHVDRFTVGRVLGGEYAVQSIAHGYHPVNDDHVGAAFNTTITPLQIYACLPMLTLYPFAVGMVCYRLAIKLAEHKRTLSALSRTDSLTGLLNHGSWKDLLKLSFEQCRQNNARATLALIDIDHFKCINDTYGHIVGDSVLRQFSKQLKDNLRAEDLAGRYGGDEFCVILPDRNLEQAQDIMERLRQVFCNDLHNNDPALRVSLSIGLASYRAEFNDASLWLGEADKALYIAKNTGRNKISIAAADVFPEPALRNPG